MCVISVCLYFVLIQKQINCHLLPVQQALNISSEQIRVKEELSRHQLADCWVEKDTSKVQRERTCIIEDISLILQAVSFNAPKYDDVSQLTI